jgi:MtN3 and saliva related transmembrane protein
VGHDRNGVKTSGNPHDSFPSGHSVHIGAVVSALSWAFPERAWEFRSAGALVAATRVAVLAHWSTDVLVGLIWVWSWSEKLAGCLPRRIGGRSPVSCLYFSGTTDEQRHCRIKLLPRVTVMNLLRLIGGLAAALTSLSYLPQVKKAWPRQSTDDLSLVMLIVLTSGLWLWTVYGILKSDWVIITANIVGGTLSSTILICKLRDLRLRTTKPRSLSRDAGATTHLIAFAGQAGRRELGLGANLADSTSGTLLPRQSLEGGLP